MLFFRLTPRCTGRKVCEEAAPPERSGHVVVAVGTGRLAVHGGTCMGARGDLWLYDAAANVWQVRLVEPPMQSISNALSNPAPSVTWQVCALEARPSLCNQVHQHLPSPLCCPAGGAMPRWCQPVPPLDAHRRLLRGG